MAVIKIFDSIGTKTIELMGTAVDQPYDDEVDEDTMDMDVELEEDN